MKFLIIFVLALTAVSAFRIDVYEEDSALEQNDIDGRIINGDRASLEDFPWNVGLTIIIRSTSQAFCGGSIIEKNWVLTAAHCVDFPFEYVIIRAGSIQRTNGGIEVVIPYDPSLFKKHPDWNSSLITNDIALIRTPTFVTSAYIAIVKIPANDFSSYAGEVGIVCGFGKAKDNGGVSNILLYANLTIIPNSECEKYFGSIVRITNICTFQTNKQSPCSGDSGSSLVSAAGEIVGIVSFGGVPCDRAQPAGYTRVSKYVNWIKSITLVYK